MQAHLNTPLRNQYLQQELENKICNIILANQSEQAGLSVVLP